MVTEAISPVTNEPPRLQMSYEEFLAWADEDTHAEWVDGEVIIQMPPQDVHQTLLGFLYHLLSSFTDLFDLGQVRVAPFEMKLSPDGPSREPDILFITKENLERLTPERLVGPADLVVEIVSGGSVQRDRDKKFKEYEAAGVREYWIIDPRPTKRRADFFELDEAGQYTLFATEDDERVSSALLPNFWLRPAWLWQADSLSPLTVFMEMRGLSPEKTEAFLRELREGAPEEEEKNE